MSQQQPRNAQEQMDTRMQLEGLSTGQQEAVRRASDTIAERKDNPEFLERYTHPDVDREKYDWIEDEYGPELSRWHILGRRSRQYERQAEWLGRNHVERMLAEARMGRLLRENPEMAVIALGIDNRPDKELPKPITPDEARVYRDSQEVITNRKSQSVGGGGTEALTTVQTETSHVTKEREEAGGIRERVGRWMD